MLNVSVNKVLNLAEHDHNRTEGLCTYKTEVIKHICITVDMQAEENASYILIWTFVCVQSHQPKVILKQDA